MGQAREWIRACHIWLGLWIWLMDINLVLLTGDDSGLPIGPLRLFKSQFDDVLHEHGGLPFVLPIAFTFHLEIRTWDTFLKLRSIQGLM